MPYVGDGPMTTQTLRRQFTIHDYARMREAGIFAEDDRVELLDGEIYLMSPLGPLHIAIVNRLNKLLVRQVADDAIVSIQNAVRLNDYSEPQPDVAILQPRDDFYAGAHPVAEDVLLVIEVADTSVEYDRAEKLPRYAAAQIAEAWLIDVASETLEQYWQPRNGKYLLKRLAERGDVVAAQAIPILQMPVDRIFE